MILCILQNSNLVVDANKKQGGKCWQVFGERKEMHSIVSSDTYLLIRDKYVFFSVFANTWKHCF